MTGRGRKVVGVGTGIAQTSSEEWQTTIHDADKFQEINKQKGTNEPLKVGSNTG
jgi:hypothetical protein